MEENLITKKELLEITGISYGALYRWKRMKLLPDDWFIHRSTFTGHETFFPRDKVLARVEEIQRLKETMSLDEIAQRFRPGPPGEVSMTGGGGRCGNFRSAGDQPISWNLRKGRSIWLFGAAGAVYLLRAFDAGQPQPGRGL